MTKVQHTPGPWKLGKRLPKGSISIDAESHQELATCVWVMDDDEICGVRSPECEANARLIAAAPTAFAEIEKLLQILNAAKILDGADAYNIAAMQQMGVIERLIAGHGYGRLAKIEGGAA